MPPKPLTDFIYANESFPAVSPDLADDISPLDLTVHICNGLRATKYGLVHKTLYEHKYTVVRLFVRKVLYKHGKPQWAKFDLGRVERATSMVIALCATQTNTKSCSACEEDGNMGPHKDCISAGQDFALGACSNCYYSGNGHNCSIRLDLEAEKARQESFEEFGEVQAELATVRDLERFRKELEREEEERIISAKRARRG